MTEHVCRICGREPVLGADKSSVFIHSLSGLRALKNTRNKELQKATSQFEKRRRGHTNGCSEAVLFAELQQELSAVNSRKKDIESRIQQATRLLNALNSRKEALAKRNSSLQASCRGAEETNETIRTNLVITCQNFEGNLKKAVAARRYKAVLELFVSFPIVSASRRGLSEMAGYSTICGVPIPNSGVYSGISDEIIRTGLGFIAHLMDILGTTLNVTLPHPLQPFLSAWYAGVGLLSTGEMQFLPLTPLLISASGDDKIDNPNFDLAHEMLAANVAYVCLALKMKPHELYPARALLLNLQLIHTECMRRAQELMPYMHAHLSSSATGSFENSDATELVHTLVHRYRSLEKGRKTSEYLSYSRNKGEQEWLLIDNDAI